MPVPIETRLDTGDPRWLLVERILGSPLFEKSPRLRAFLTFICELELTGRRLEINEQLIGVEVFGRPAAYNPGEDSIVRSQARFLRQRLEEYFRTFGVSEPLRLTIPKGSYIPLFEASPMALPSSSAELSLLPAPVEPATDEGEGPSPRRFASIWIAAAALIILFGFFVSYRAFRKAAPAQSSGSRFWKALFDPRRSQVIVPADSTLILIEELSGKPVSLQSYLSRDYLTNAPLANYPPALTSAELGASHYTSMADLNFVSRLLRVPALAQTRAEIRYARDLSITDVKEDNVVLIGGPRANPWVELFAGHMNFYVDYDWKTHQNSVINKAPKPGEAALYVEGAEPGAAAAVRVYALIAYQPSLDNEGDALLAAGTSSAGTQAAADFLTTGTAFDEFLRQVQRPDGSIPHFEVLLVARNLGGNTAPASIVAYRVMR